MSGAPRPTDRADEIPWPHLADAEFVAHALPEVESWVAAGRFEQRLMVALDDELAKRIAEQRQRRRRAGSHAQAGEFDLRPLAYVLLMAMDMGGEDILARALRLAGVHALMCLLAGEPVAAPTWSHAHRMFARAENLGRARSPSEFGPSLEALYLRLLLLSTLAGNGMSARQLDKCFDWFGAWCADIHVDAAYDPQRHYFAVDLEGGAGLVPVEPKAQMRLPRYVAHAELVVRAGGARTDYFRQISVSTLGLYGSNPLFEYHDALHQLSRYWDYVAVRHAGHDTGRQRMGDTLVAAVSGFDACIETVNAGATKSRWTLVDLSPTGAGISISGSGSRGVEKGALAVFFDPAARRWVLGTIVRTSPGAQAMDIGVRRLAEDWRLIRLTPDLGDAEDPPVEGLPRQEPHAGFFIFGDETRGLADSLLLRAGSFDPSRTWSVRPGRELYRIRLSRVIQSAGDWERIGFDVLKRL